MLARENVWRDLPLCVCVCVCVCECVCVCVCYESHVNNQLRPDLCNICVWNMSTLMVSNRLNKPVT